jgi:hypothetical protein
VDRQNTDKQYEQVEVQFKLSDGTETFYYHQRRRLLEQGGHDGLGQQRSSVAMVTATTSISTGTLSLSSTPSLSSSAPMPSINTVAPGSLLWS